MANESHNKSSSSSSSSGRGGAPSALTMLLIEWRWLFVVPIVLPLSFLYDKLWQIRQIFYELFQAAPKLHDRRVKAIQDQVVNWNKAGRPGGRLATARSEWLSISIRPEDYKTNCNKIKIDLYDVLAIDTKNRTVRVEPGVSMGQLTKALAKHGWTIPVVPELDDLTVGGLVNGYGIEGSSHKYGLFCDTCTAYEVVVASGELIRATPTNEHKDLFHGLPWSYGALGFLVAVEINIIPIQHWVHLVYRPVFGQGVDGVTKAFEQAMTGGADVPDARSPSSVPEFVEGLMYDKETAVIMTGNFVDAPPGPFARVNRIGLWYKPWFYKHVQTILHKAIAAKRRGNAAPSMLERVCSVFCNTSQIDATSVYDEYIPIRDYYHRHTRSIFWQGELIVPMGNNPIFRVLCGWMMPPKISFLKLTQPKSIREYHDEMMVVQDLLVPVSVLGDALTYFDKTFRCYPIWLCGHRTYKTEPQGALKPAASLPKGQNYEMYVDVGMYFIPGVKNYEAEKSLREMESWLIDNRGYQALYAQTHMTRAQFRQMFDCTLYDKLRAKHNAEGVFMDAYDKVCLKKHASPNSR
ncbi:24-dehydrocholesterol reductase [Capsaspora owczarzaki ATCC 30864]|uniref:Delta(24)-sterol reductase n=1 Tax=Capsaspora owczarzaki (strain ATCC 30864) TaxID=595528 RepID=A0A0D2X2Z0_CAPO3|nr:24-dehydrocholesterol reductase [Capsaspora owczarzaki ATCC 30864]KJE93394.1 24-dehydrocholesterol reductase [Capsaspora owczarzaki ATCC 30864]|eukprot:XP_004348012.1 24-dehydrocholesterol reductase [Capsaspora owczarzaki ATCC 30864]